MFRDHACKLHFHLSGPPTVLISDFSSLIFSWFYVTASNLKNIINSNDAVSVNFASAHSYNRFELKKPTCHYCKM